jgi:hypothetical protein
MGEQSGGDPDVMSLEERLAAADPWREALDRLSEVAGYAFRIGEPSEVDPTKETMALLTRAAGQLEAQHVSRPELGQLAEEVRDILYRLGGVAAVTALDNARSTAPKPQRKSRANARK